MILALLNFDASMNSVSKSTPPVIVNGRFLTQQVSGVQAFARSVCRELNEVISLKFVVSQNEELIDEEFQSSIVTFGKLKGHLWEQIDLPAYVKKHPEAILLNLCNTAPLRLRNHIVTIHDLAFYHHPEWFKWLFSSYYNFLVPKICKNSKAIFTVSETIKTELVEHLGVNEQKISVISNKAGVSFMDATLKLPVNFPFKKDEFFLMVGTNDPRKNFALAASLFQQGFCGKKLVIAGGNNKNFKATSINKYNSETILKTGYVNDAELKWLYQNACGLINPSLYEGFGIPNIEAFSQGCAVICSELPVFREVCKDAAWYFNPHSTESLKTTLENYLENYERVGYDISKGKVIFEEFQAKNRSSIILNALMK